MTHPLIVIEADVNLHFFVGSITLIGCSECGLEPTKWLKSMPAPDRMKFEQFYAAGWCYIAIYSALSQQRVGSQDMARVSRMFPVPDT